MNCDSAPPQGLWHGALYPSPPCKRLSQPLEEVITVTANIKVLVALRYFATSGLFQPSPMSLPPGPSPSIQLFNCVSVSSLSPSERYPPCTAKWEKNHTVRGVRAPTSHFTSFNVRTSAWAPKHHPNPAPIFTK